MIHDTFGLRLLLERDAVRAFAVQPDRSVIQNLLEEVNAALVEVRADMSSRSLDHALEVDWRMHDTVIECFGNQLVSEIYRINAVRLRLIKANNRLNPDRVFGALEEHVSILTHCRDGDPEGAARAMESHIRTALNRALQGI
jgi:DNA-binding GntR family transcriptional regulator